MASLWLSFYAAFSYTYCAKENDIKITSKIIAWRLKISKSLKAYSNVY